MKIIIIILSIYLFINLIYSIEINREYHLNIINDIENNNYQGGIDDQIIEYSVLESNIENEYKIVKGFQDDSIANCYYMSNINVNGWIYLSLTTYSRDGKYNDLVQSAAAGYLEGVITADSILQSKINYYVNTFESPTEIPPLLKDWIRENIANMGQFFANQNSTYWQQVSMTWTQINSMVDGYNSVASKQSDYLDIYDFFILNMYGDLYDIIPSISGLNLPKFKKDNNNIQEWFKIAQRCSSSVKVTDDYSELYAGHTTFTPYSTMLRIFKSYTFDYSIENGTVSKRNLFSSYPGSLTSLDDFYQMMDSKLVVMETTNSLVSNDLYHLIRPDAGLLCWIRVMIANRMSSNGKQWCEIFSLYNSGTYNNQWIVIDYKKFTPYKELKDGALYILEQIPKYIEYADQTSILRSGSWASYNVPFYETIYNASGYNNYTGNDYNKSTIYYMSHDTCPRAELFRELSGQVKTLDDFQSLLRYNDYQNNPLSHGIASYAISARYDLNSINPSPHGGIDTKVTCNSLVNMNNVVAISGPTTYNNQPVFKWSTFKNTTANSYLGVPDEFNFPWVSFSNTTFRNLK